MLFEKAELATLTGLRAVTHQVAAPAFRPVVAELSYAGQVNEHVVCPLPQPASPGVINVDESVLLYAPSPTKIW